MLLDHKAMDTHDGVWVNIRSSAYKCDVRDLLLGGIRISYTIWGIQRTAYTV